MPAAINLLLRNHLRSQHSVEEFDPDATEVSLLEFHHWDHETGEMGPPHDEENLRIARAPRPVPTRKKVGPNRGR